MSLSEEYKDKFISKLHDALSGFSSSNVEESVRYLYYSTEECRNKVRRNVSG